MLSESWAVSKIWAPLAWIRGVLLYLYLHDYGCKSSNHVNIIIIHVNA